MDSEAQETDMHTIKSSGKVIDNAHIVTHEYDSVVVYNLKCMTCNGEWTMFDFFMGGDHRTYCPYCGTHERVDI